MGRIDELKERLEKAQALYKEIEEDAGKVRMFEVMGELEEQIRNEEYKINVMNGDD
jgi:hypothetical protein